MQTGYGWDATGKEGAGRGRSSHSYEDQMRAEIRYRAQGGTSGWHGRGRPTYGGHRYGYRESDAGRGAWGGFRGGDGKWEAYDTGEFSTSPGTGEERYMSNTQFLGLIAGIVSCHPQIITTPTKLPQLMITEYRTGLGSVSSIHDRKRSGYRITFKTTSRVCHLCLLISKPERRSGPELTISAHHTHWQKQDKKRPCLEKSEENGYVVE